MDFMTFVNTVAQETKLDNQSLTNITEHSDSNDTSFQDAASVQPWHHAMYPVNQSLVAPSPKIIQGPHLSIMILLLGLLYAAILWDILYIVGNRYFASWLPGGRKRGTGGNRRHHQNHTSATSQVTIRKKLAGKMTLDLLWRRIKAEARFLQRVNIQHRSITQAMMETRLQARSQLERDRSLTKTNMSRRLSTVTDHKIDMVRWAARISSDDDPRAK
ncbi:hypothetical protein EGW08_001431 [Elysia chlorotica]|uniref:Uncharacterized protein n=1 Tax=Elysia chlorotica TaxID=188477 RepID=A0A3S1AFV5_ELYCH|nr:hypothetical protein EGW08_001431 [Elysia chlorotica]